MQIMSQNGRQLINGDYVSQFFIEETENGAKLMAAADVDILLGTYDKVAHAEMALKFIGVCMVDEDAQSKITQVPTREDMEMGDKLASGDLNPTGLKKLFEHAVSSRGGAPENSDDSGPDLLSLLRGLLD